jgi:predicted mannosyl-3-phosphoglycerate phosphatase (HAD superfamily)
MLDHPEKTARLLAALKTAVPFEVELAPPVMKQLQADKVDVAPRSTQTVSDLSYLGDEGGIMCHIVPPESEGAIIISLTHVRVPRSMPLAAAVLSYQKHRVKKLKKQGHAG